MPDYDISEAFARIENELISSMFRNFKRHRAEETKEGYNWDCLLYTSPSPRDA